MVGIIGNAYPTYDIGSMPNQTLVCTLRGHAVYNDDRSLERKCPRDDKHFLEGSWGLVTCIDCGQEFCYLCLNMGEDPVGRINQCYECGRPLFWSTVSKEWKRLTI